MPVILVGGLRDGWAYTDADIDQMKRAKEAMGGTFDYAPTENTKQVTHSPKGKGPVTYTATIWEYIGEPHES